MSKLNFVWNFLRKGKREEASSDDKNNRLLSLNSFRIRLFLFALLMLLPLYGLAVYIYLNERTNELDESRDELTNIANIFVAEDEHLIEDAHLILNVLAELPDVQGDDFEKCNNLMASIMRIDATYANFGVADAGGNIICNGLPFEGTVNVADRSYFREAMKTNDFSVGEYQIGRITKKASINFGHPTHDKSGSKRIVYIALDLEMANRLIPIDVLPEQALFSLVDGNGTLLLRYPEAEHFVGQSIPEATKKFLADRKEGIMEDVDLDGVDRVFNIKNIKGTDLYVRIGFSRDLILAEANRVFANEILLLGVITIFVFFILEIGGRQLIIRQIEELQKIDRLKDEFVSLVSHQLRTPLSSMKWGMELLSSKDFGELNDKQRDMLGDMINANNHLNDLVGELLDISRIESGKLQVNFQNTNLIEVAKDILKELNPQFIEKSLKLKIGFVDIMPDINADPLLLRQILMNLLSNAVKYTPANGTIEFSIGYDDYNARIAICDSGIGIPKKDQKLIFSRFFRASNIDPKIQGTGLGLNLTKSLVELMAGEIGFNSEEGKGATFWIYLPLAKKSA